MYATNDLAVVKRFSVISLIAVAILDDGIEELARYMAEAGYPEERDQLLSVLAVELSHSDPRCIVHFSFRGSNGSVHKDGKFFIWIRDDENVGGDF
jgi:hypothetical protein